jgi:hypothetical protein
MYQNRDELLAYARLGLLPRAPRTAAPRRRWRWRPDRIGPAPRRRRVPPPAVPVGQEPLSPQEYLELEFAVGEESRR